MSANTVTYTYDAANRLLQAGGRLFSYDATGNRIAEAHEGRATEYHYDAGNRLIRVRQASTEVHYGYDGDGNKVARQVVEKDRIRALDFSSDTVPALPVILTVTGPESSTTYTYGHALISQDTEDASGRRRDPVELFYHFDGLGSVVNMTDSGGRARQEFEYGPWGESLLSGEDANRQTRFGFTGEERDEQTDLYYLRARWYDPSVGRFLSEDPFGFSSGDTNLYRYVFNNPISFRDPSGLAGIGSSDPFITGVWAPSSLSSFASLGASPLIQFASVGSPFASLGASPLMPFSSVGSPLSSLGVSPLISIASLSATPLLASTSLAGLGGPQPIEIVRLNGSVDVRHDGESSWAGVFSSAGISPSDWIRTHDASLARVVFSDGSVATIYERTVSQASNIAPDKFSLQEFLHKLWESVQHFMRNAPTETSTPSAVLGIKG